MDLTTDHSRAALEGAHSHGAPRYVASRADRDRKSTRLNSSHW